MDFKSFGFGVLAAVLVLVTVGASFAAIQGNGTITIPTGKWAIYFFVPNTDYARFETVYEHKYNATLEQQDVLAYLNTDAKNCIVNIVKSGEAHIARENALKGTPVTN